jgi:hypothetical protein
MEVIIVNKVGNRILAAGSVLSLAVCLLAFGGGGEKPTCAVLSFEGAGAEDAGMAVLACSKFAGLAAKNDKYDVIPRLTVNQNLSAQSYDRAEYKSTAEAGVAAGAMLKMNYVVIGNVGHTTEGYTLEASLLNVKNGDVVKNVKTRRTSDMREFATSAATEAAELMFGPAKPKQEAPVQVAAAAVVPVAKPAIVVEPVKQAPKVVAPQPEPVVEPVKAVAEVPAVTTPSEPVPAQVAVPEPIIDLGGEQAKQPETPVIAGPSSLGQNWLADHVQVGTRMTMVSLIHTKKSGEGGNFLGSIQELKAIQDEWPTKIYADIYPWQYFGVELTWGNARARTGAWNYDDNVPYHTDGDFAIDGPIVSLIGRYPNSTKFTPYAGIGMALMHARYVPAAWWHGGFPSEAAWEESGSPTEIVLPLIRNLDPRSTHGQVYFAGCDYSITDNLLAGVYVRYMAASLDVEFTEQLQDYLEHMGTYKIPMDNVAYGLGISYAF